MPRSSQREAVAALTDGFLASSSYIQKRGHKEIKYQESGSTPSQNFPTLSKCHEISVEMSNL